MVVDTFTTKEQAIGFIERNFPVLEHHQAPNADIKRSKEFFVLKQFIHTDDPILRYPIRFRHCGMESGFPDFTLIANETAYLVEVTEITDKESQFIFQHRQDVVIGEVIGNVDLTPAVKSIVERKNSKLAKYKESTQIENSILLLDHNKWPPFSYGSPGDELRHEEIKSHFDHTFIFIPIFGVNKSYLKI